MRTIYGINAVREALSSERTVVARLNISKQKKGAEIDGLIKTAKEAGLKVERSEPSTLTELAGTSAHQGVVAECGGGYPYVSLDEIVTAASTSKGGGEAKLLIVLDSIEDPQNMGALIRSALAAGADGVVIPKDRSAAVTGSVVKASAGATEHMRVARVSNIASSIERLKEEGIWTVALEADGKEPLYRADLTVDLALVVGSEGRGIRRLVRERCDYSASIPLSSNIGSLNAAQAGSIALFEAVRQRAEEGER